MLTDTEIYEEVCKLGIKDELERRIAVEEYKQYRKSFKMKCNGETCIRIYEYVIELKTG